MFTREELIGASELLANRPKPLVEVLNFTSDDFPSGSSEETIMICRGSQFNFESALHFWVAAQQCADWSGREAYFLPCLKEAVCQPLTEQAFMLMLRQTCGLKHPLVITPKGEYVGGQRMADECCDYSALAEFEHEYLSFNWETTA